MSVYVAINDYDHAYNSGAKDWDSIVLNGSPQKLKIEGVGFVIFGSTMKDGEAMKLHVINSEGFKSQHYIYHSSSGMSNYIAGYYPKENGDKKHE